VALPTGNTFVRQGSSDYQKNRTQEQSIDWRLGDLLDRRLMQIALPVVANFAIAPLIGAIDLFWVNQMRDPLAVAGQSAANQVFTSVFFLTSFLPSVAATLIAKEHARGNTDGVQDAIGHALFVGFGLAVISSSLLLWHPDKVRFLAF
jgi:Na+-driven multidrug efflux pump